MFIYENQIYIPADIKLEITIKNTNRCVRIEIDFIIKFIDPKNEDTRYNILEEQKNDIYMLLKKDFMKTLLNYCNYNRPECINLKSSKMYLNLMWEGEYVVLETLTYLNGLSIYGIQQNANILVPKICEHILYKCIYKSENLWLELINPHLIYVSC
jgi:hypothetical protein